MGNEIVMIIGSGMSGICFMSILLFLLYAWYASTTTTGGGQKTKPPKPTPSDTSKKCKAKKTDCAYTTRVQTNGSWACPVGYEDTNCNWSPDGKEKGKLQCRACGENSPYAAYQIANPNCPSGFIPCNDRRFNYGDLKKNAQGEFYYDAGWGVDASDYDWAGAGANPAGGSITLNQGKFGGTDAHPEVFAKGCCAWGNSVDDPERDKANKTISIATSVVSGVVSAASFALAPFTGGASVAGALALQGASAGLGAGGQLIRAKCGGPTERYKKTKRNYMFKGPYKDGNKVRGTAGIWYTANDGCPLKWLQFVPQA